MQTFPNVAAFLLVGGKSSRMGQDKALLELAGAPLIQRTAALLDPLVAQVTLVTSATAAVDSENAIPYSNFGLSIISDRWPNAGPLGGIATALAAAKASWCLIIACDMPSLTKEWLTFLLGEIARSEDETKQRTDVIIPEATRGLEPLCAVYRSSCAPILAAALDRGIRKVTAALAELNMKRIAEREWRQFSPDGSLFGNLNTWQDYLEAQQRLNS